MIKFIQSVILFVVVWGSIASLPLVLTWNDNYKTVFPSEWFDVSPRDYWNEATRPSPLGLTLGITAVVIGQVCTLIYFLLLKNGYLGKPLTPIQKKDHQRMFNTRS